MDQKSKSVRERAEEWACNNGVPHTNRDMPAWHYDAIAWLAGFKACAEMAAGIVQCTALTKGMCNGPTKCMACWQVDEIRALAGITNHKS